MANMKMLVFLIGLTTAWMMGAGVASAITLKTHGSQEALTADGKPVFPIGFTRAPEPGALTPDGKNGYEELAQYGFVFHRVDANNWGPKTEAQVDIILEESAKYRLYAALSVPDLVRIGPNAVKKQAELRRVVTKYRDNPGMGLWKGDDEPEWGKHPVRDLMPFIDTVHELDPAHPVWITQAPRGTIESLKAYDATYDIGAIDIYPIGYPAGVHSHLANKNISVVGDYARWMQQITGNKKPFFMALQIAWSGVVNEGKTLRFPTFHEERYMAYQSIINGARGIIFFGGSLRPALNERDRQLTWNWTFYDNVLKRVLQELKPGSPVFPALIAPSSKAKVKVEIVTGEPGKERTQAAGDQVEVLVREAGDYVFILAAKREGDTVRARISGVPAVDQQTQVLYEEPRSATVQSGVLTDWFAPNEVHVYRMKKQ